MMKSIPPVLERAFRLEMGDLGMLSKGQRDWLKWLRYYLDFCLKNGLNPRGREHEEAFVGKLREKRQTEEQQEDARACLDVFYKIVPRFGGPLRRGAGHAELEKGVPWRGQVLEVPSWRGQAESVIKVA